MKITLLVIGKTSVDYIVQGVDDFQKRLGHYTSFQQIVIPEIKQAKHLSPEQYKAKEYEGISPYLSKFDVLVLLDEHGQAYSSVHFSTYLQKQMNQGVRHMGFLVGGPYGFDERVYTLAHHKMSLSSMTFSHQLIRLLFVEQLYRAFTILKNEKYHNE